MCFVIGICEDSVLTNTYEVYHVTGWQLFSLPSHFTVKSTVPDFFASSHLDTFGCIKYAFLGTNSIVSKTSCDFVINLFLTS